MCTGLFREKMLEFYRHPTYISSLLDQFTPTQPIIMNQLTPRDETQPQSCCSPPPTPPQTLVYSVVWFISHPPTTLSFCGPEYTPPLPSPRSRNPIPFVVRPGHHQLLPHPPPRPDSLPSITDMMIVMHLPPKSLLLSW